MAYVNYKQGADGNYSNPNNWEILTPAPKKYYFYGSGYFHQTLKWRDENGKRVKTTPSKNDEIFLLPNRCHDFAFGYALYYRFWYWLLRKKLPEIEIRKGEFGVIGTIYFSTNVTFSGELVFIQGIVIRGGKHDLFTTNSKNIKVIDRTKCTRRFIDRFKMEIPF